MQAASQDTWVLRPCTQHRGLQGRTRTELRTHARSRSTSPPLWWPGSHSTCLSFQAWKAHLMGPTGCTVNLRRTHVLRKAPTLPPGKHPPGLGPVSGSRRSRVIMLSAPALAEAPPRGPASPLTELRNQTAGVRRRTPGLVSLRAVGTSVRKLGVQ